MEINRETAIKVLEVVDAGLSSGVGDPRPGFMCVEAAVCYALGLPHGDDPQCVSPALRALKIRINDSNWSSKKARAKGLRRLAIAQLGSAGALDEQEFVRRVVDYAIGVSAPKALRIAAAVHKDPQHKAALLAAASRCEVDRNRKAAIEARDAANAAAYAAAAAANAYADAANANAYAYAAAAAANAYADAAAANAYAYAAAAAANAYADAAAANAYADADAAAANAYADAAAANAYADADAANAYADADAAAANAAAYADARDKSLAEYAEAIVQILIELKAPGCQWLDLAEVA